MPGSVLGTGESSIVDQATWPLPSPGNWSTVLWFSKLAHIRTTLDALIDCS